MAGSSDRARYFLEQSIPELRELLKKEVFSKVSAPSTDKRERARPILIKGRKKSQQSPRRDLISNTC
jgi:hypothetical protein